MVSMFFTRSGMVFFFLFYFSVLAENPAERNSFCLQSLLPNTLDEALHISVDPWSIQKGKVWSCGQEITIMVFNVAVFAE